MSLLLLVAALLVTYWLGLIGIPELLLRVMPGTLRRAEQKFPGYRGNDALRMLVVTRLGIAGAIVAVISMVCMAANWHRG